MKISLESIMQSDKKMKKLFKKNIPCTDIRGKMITFYGDNDTGKTSQCSNFPNPIFLSAENSGALNGYSTSITTLDEVSNATQAILRNKNMDKLLKQEPVCLIIDGLEKIGFMGKDAVASEYGVSDVADGKGGYGLWGQLEMKLWVAIKEFIFEALDRGFTIISIGHQKYVKEIDKFIIFGEERIVKLVRDDSDFVFYLEKNGVDEDGEVIPSTAYANNCDEFFARSRYDSGDGIINPFTADNIISFMRESVIKTAKRKGIEYCENFFESGNANNRERYDYLELIEWLKMAESTIFVQDENLIDGFYLIMEKYIKDGTITNLSQCGEQHTKALLAFKNNLCSEFNKLCEKHKIKKNPSDKNCRYVEEEVFNGIINKKLMKKNDDEE